MLPIEPIEQSVRRLDRKGSLLVKAQRLLSPRSDRSTEYFIPPVGFQGSKVHFAWIRVSGHGAFLPASVFGSHDPFS